MAIVIKTEKVVDNSGELCREILDVELLNRDNVPDLYWKNKQPAVILSVNKREIFFGHPYFETDLRIGETILEIHFQERMEYIRKAGENLRNVREKLAKLRETWNGDETFVI